MRALFLLSALAMGCAGSDLGTSAPDGLMTRPERTDYAETSSYSDVMAHIQAVALQSSDLQVGSYGESGEGRALPLVVWGAEGTSPEAVLGTAKTRVLLLGNIHAGEVAGKEALLVLLRDLAEGDHAAWADSLTLLVAPIYNADGNERVAFDNRRGQLGPVGGMGQRTNAADLDLNRDFMKLASPEGKALVDLIKVYDPHVIVDLHTTNGTIHAYHLTYAPPLHPNTPSGIDTELWERWLPTVTDAIEAQDGMLIQHYGNVPGAFGEPVSIPRGWYSFDPRPRFSTNYAGLRNRFGILSEAYSYAPFEERIVATRRFVEEVLDYAHDHAARLRQLTGEADATSIVGDSLAVRATYARLDELVTIQLGAVDTVYHPVTNAPMLERRADRFPEAMPAFTRFAASESERVPAAYLVPEDRTEILDLLEAHGIESYPAMSPSSVEAFEITSVEPAPRSFQGRVALDVSGYYGQLDDSSRSPVHVVQLDQPLGRLAFMLLEPRSDDGLAAWGILPDGVVAPGRYWPVQRLHGSLPPR